MAILDGNYWFSDASGDAPLPIANIVNSLRGRGPGTGRLARTPAQSGDRTTYTISFWIKDVENAGGKTIYAAERFQANDGSTYGQFAGNMGRHDPATNISWNIGTTRFRDPGAWYHWCWVADTNNPVEADRARFYINGERITISGTNLLTQGYETGWNAAVTTTIFDAADPSDAGVVNFEGYLADFYNIDGQALEPTAFGLYDEEGVWVPRQVDFTPATPRYSDFLTASVGTFASGAVNAFDGVVNGTNASTSIDGQLTFAPDPAIPFTNLRAASVVAVGNNTFVWNGNSVASTAQGDFTQIFSGAGELSTATPLVINAAAGERAELSAVEITDANGARILLNPFLYSADLFTNPGTATPDWNTTDKQFAAPGGAATGAFDGNDSTEAGTLISPNVGTWVIWRPSTPIVARNSVQVTTRFNESIFVNEVDTGLNAPASSNLPGTTVDLSPSLTFPITIESIGLRGNSSGANASEGRVTNIIIDGQPLIDGVNNSYGANGFHLTFEDPNDLGKDYSGNNNNFTATGFDTAPVGTFSDDVPTPTGGWETAGFGEANPTRLFDGSDATFCQCTNAVSYTFTPDTPIAYNSLEYNAAGSQYQLNGGATGGSGSDSGWVTIDPNPGTLTTLTFVPPTGTIGPAARGIRINGTTVLTDNSGTDYDLMQDSPSQNYATLNPLQQPPLENLTNANLNTASTGISSSVAPNGTVNVPINGRVYVEFRCESVNGSYPRFGFSKLRTSDSNAHTTGDWAVNPTGGIISVASSQNAGITFGAGDVVCIAWDRQANKAWFAVNGNVDTSTAGITLDQAFTDEEVVFAVVFNARNTNVSSSAINFGQQPFVGQVPAGFSVLQTQNLPAAPIPNGTDHFRALTAPGASILDVARANLNGYFDAAGFAQGLWWIKDMDNVNQHQLLDSVRGGTDAILSPSLNAATAYSAPTGDSAAWCWNAPDTWASTDADITAGTLASSGRRNKEAGFSIINFTGNATAGATIAHGLDEAPEFFILKPYTAGNTQIYVYSTAEVGNQSAVFLNSSGSKVADSNIYWNSTSPNQNFITLGSAATTNATTPVSIYAWHSVPGYSAFGSYEGNDDSDGVFVYTGFRPAFVMFKAVNTSADWIIYDTTRNPTNPVDARLMPSRDLEERTSTGMHVDFLSNGFKHRNQELDLNNNFTYIYAAFASNPFGGSNVNPNTAALTGPPQISGITAGISKSLRFRADSNLSKVYNTFGSTTWSELCTHSFWVKSGVGGSGRLQWFAPDIGFSGGDREWSGFEDTGVFRITGSPTNSSTQQVNIDGLYRDPSAWYHVVINSDGTNLRVWINGELRLTTTTRWWGGAAFAPDGNSMRYRALTGSNGGYFANVYFIDGQVLEPTVFGEYNDDNIWVPVEDPTITDYGTNGFKLVMDPAYQSGTTLQDQSGNGNDFTMNGFDTDDYFSADFDFMKDGPSQNYATLNRLFYAPDSTQTFSDANLKIQDSDASFPNNTPSTIVLTGRKYWEITIETVVAQYPQIGVSRLNERNQNNQDYKFSSCYVPMSGIAGRNFDQDLATWVTVASGDVVGVEYNADTKEITWTKNGGDAFTVTVRSDDDLTPYLGSAVNSIASVNFGQQPFSYQPAGTAALQTQNLTAPTITDGRDHFRALIGGTCDCFNEGNIGATDALVTTDPFDFGTAGNNQNCVAFDLLADYTTAGMSFVFNQSPDPTLLISIDGTTWRNLGTISITANTPVTITDGAAFRFVRLHRSTAFTQGVVAVNNSIGLLELAQQTFDSGLWWIKDRVNSNQHQLVCSALGTNRCTQTPGIVGEVDYVAPAGNSVAWCWNWNQANPSVNGFDIVEYTGDTTSGALAVNHNLGTAPEFMIVQNLRNTSPLYAAVYHAGPGATQGCFLNQNVAFTVNGGFWADTPPNGTQFTVGAGGFQNVNNTGDDFIAYLWTSVPGYSAFGTYVGNGAPNDDGPFIYLGFRPAWVMTRRINGSHWSVWDSTQVPTNPVNFSLQPDQLGNSNNRIDILANGFKVRNLAQVSSNDGEQYIYCAFAENPFGGSNTVPVTAR